MHVAIERSCSLYEMKSDNLVEGVFSWLKEERALGTPFYVIQALFRKSSMLYSTLRESAAEDVNLILTRRATNTYSINQQMLNSQKRVYTII